MHTLLVLGAKLREIMDTIKIKDFLMLMENFERRSLINWKKDIFQFFHLTLDYNEIANSVYSNCWPLVLI